MANVTMLPLLRMGNEMTTDLTPRWKDFAVYLPAIQFPFASTVDSDKNRDKKRPFPKGIKLTDLDFLNPKSKLWHYGYGLYSVGQFTDASPKACCVTNRDKTCTTILGDSGGFQIGNGTLKGTEHFKKAKTNAELMEVWRGSGDIRKRIVTWLNNNCDYAMTIDMPLWAREPSKKGTPFHKCSEDELIAMTLDNLKYIQQHRKGNTKWLNVLQGTTGKDSKQWWDAVKRYKFDGYAIAGGIGWRGGLINVLNYVLMMRDDNAFEVGNDWMHMLGVSQPIWAVLNTAIQKNIRKVCNNPTFRISYDSASPFQHAGRYQCVARYPKLMGDPSTWVMTAHEAPINPLYANTNGTYRFPYPSPIGDLLTLDHLNVNGGEFRKRTYDSISDHLLTNHNVWVYVRSFLEANELAFMLKSDADKAVPQKLLDAIAYIEYIMTESSWKTRLQKDKKFLTDLFGKAQFVFDEEREKVAYTE
jgi:hypothetical protein